MASVVESVGEPPSPDAAVRKIVTVLFADLGGSTGFGERTDAEVARATMAGYHALLQDVIDAHGGRVAKFMGDGMMATFGIPVVAEDDAERAIRAGVDAQQRFSEFAAQVAKRYGETLTLRVGINTGEVVIGAGDADIVGDALNVAARLEKEGLPGQVLVGDDTWRLTRGAFGYEALGEVLVAGRAEAVSIYRVARDPCAGRVGGTVRGPRRRDCSRLRAVFDRAVAQRSAQFVDCARNRRRRQDASVAGIVRARRRRRGRCHVRDSVRPRGWCHVRADRRVDRSRSRVLDDDAGAIDMRASVAALFAERRAQTAIG